MRTTEITTVSLTEPVWLLSLFDVPTLVSPKCSVSFTSYVSGFSGMLDLFSYFIIWNYWSSIVFIEKCPTQWLSLMCSFKNIFLNMQGIFFFVLRFFGTAHSNFSGKFLGFNRSNYHFLAWLCPLWCPLLAVFLDKTWILKWGWGVTHFFQIPLSSNTGQKKLPFFLKSSGVYSGSFVGIYFKTIFHLLFIRNTMPTISELWWF